MIPDFLLFIATFSLILLIVPLSDFSLVYYMLINIVFVIDFIQGRRGHDFLIIALVLPTVWCLDVAC